MICKEINKYGVTLKRLTHDKIELVRRWRNHPKISQYMEYREEITPEMQEKWFRQVDNDHNLYYIIGVDNEEVGLINVKDIDFDKKEGESGIFIWDDKYLNSDISFRASCAFSDYIFLEFGLEKTNAHILSTNKRAIDFNTSFGLKELPNQDGILNKKWIQTKETYLNSRVRRIITKLYNKNGN